MNGGETKRDRNNATKAARTRAPASAVSCRGFFAAIGLEPRPASQQGKFCIRVSLQRYRKRSARPRLQALPKPSSAEPPPARVSLVRSCSVHSRSA